MKPFSGAKIFRVQVLFLPVGHGNTTRDKRGPEPRPGGPHGLLALIIDILSHYRTSKLRLPLCERASWKGNEKVGEDAEHRPRGIFTPRSFRTNNPFKGWIYIGERRCVEKMNKWTRFLLSFVDEIYFEPYWLSYSVSNLGSVMGVFLLLCFRWSIAQNIG